jgi:hypothetical protein
MPLSEAQEKRIKELHEGIKNAPASVVANERAHLLEAFEAIEELKRDLAAKKADSFGG